MSRCCPSDHSMLSTCAIDTHGTSTSCWFTMTSATLQKRSPLGSRCLGNPSPTPTHPSKFSIIQQSWSTGQLPVRFFCINLILAPKNMIHERIMLCFSIILFPALQDLQGSVELYFLTVNSAQHKQTLTLDPSVTSVVISDLQPSTEYKISLTVSNAAHNITSPEVNCTTLDGGEFMPCWCLMCISTMATQN